jgi:uncharacterized protein
MRGRLSEARSLLSPFSISDRLIGRLSLIEILSLYFSEHSQLRSVELTPTTEDPETAAFWKGAAQHRLLVQQCQACGHAQFPPHPGCEACGSADAPDWVEVSGRGKIWSFIVVHPPTLPALAPFAPFPAVIVQLDEHPNLRIPGNIVAAPDAPINSVPADEISIGARVTVCFEYINESLALPRWILDKSKVEEGDAG